MRRIIQLPLLVGIIFGIAMLTGASGNDKTQTNNEIHKPGISMDLPQGVDREAESVSGDPVVSGDKKVSAEERMLAIMPSKLNFKQKMAVKILKAKIKRDSKRIRKGKKTSGGDNQIVAAILCWLVGLLGIHRFYLGYVGIGLIQLFTAGMCGIWTLIDLIRIIIGDLQPNGGSYSTTF